MSKLEGNARTEALATISLWKEVDGRDAITRTYMFQDFKDAFAFMTKTAEYCDPKDHHPEWFNVYNKVEVTLATHTASGVTEKDIDLATAMDKFAVECKVKE
mmetsp:Transcript_113843/g.170280  ORF Transcript_113843/g.170280 Transcript_113843/m.170280 type:complete len:102 (-) Transcript_113843:40-345(-)